MRKGTIDWEEIEDAKGRRFICMPSSDVAAMLEVLFPGDLKQESEPAQGGAQPAAQPEKPPFRWTGSSFGRSLYFGQRDAKEVLAFIAWLCCSCVLLVAAVWKW
jgi:hypothetical protein